MIYLPKALYDNKIACLLDKIREDYKNLSGNGIIKGIICADQDAKIIAIDGKFDNKLNIWDLGALGAALYGVSKQGMDFFEANSLERGSIIYGNTQFFVRSIGEFNLDKRGNRELLIIVLANRRVNLGLMILHLNKYAEIIKKEVKNNTAIKETLKLSEDEMRIHIREIKNQLFKKAESLDLSY